MSKSRLSWDGDHNSLKEFAQNTLELQGNWSYPAVEKKLFVANNIETLWWKNTNRSVTTCHLHGIIKFNLVIILLRTHAL